MSISLIMVTSVWHELAEMSLRKSVAAHSFDKVILLCNKHPSVPAPHGYLQIPDEFTRIDYSIFCMKGMVNVVDTDHVLIVQPDGMAINNQYWTDEFLEYDYIGAPNNYGEAIVNSALVDTFGQEQYRGKSGWYVGNGGFSLRSKKLLNALKDERITPSVLNEKDGQHYYGEDMQICVIHRQLLEQEYGIKFAPVELALQFSTERACDNGMSFGFHGWQNIPWFLSEEECIYYIERIPPNWDQYRQNRLSGFLFEKRYYNAMQRLNQFRQAWQSF